MSNSALLTALFFDARTVSTVAFFSIKPKACKRNMMQFMCNVCAYNKDRYCTVILSGIHKHVVKC